jgi:hypothetical protein
MRTTCRQSIDDQAAVILGSNQVHVFTFEYPLIVWRSAEKPQSHYFPSTK